MGNQRGNAGFSLKMREMWENQVMMQGMKVET